MENSGVITGDDDENIKNLIDVGRRRSRHSLFKRFSKVPSSNATTNATDLLLVSQPRSRSRPSNFHNVFLSFTTEYDTIEVQNEYRAFKKPGYNIILIVSVIT